MSTWVPANKYDRCRFLLSRGFLEEMDIQWLVHDVFPSHPHWREKKRGGVKTVVIKRASRALGQQPTFCFHIVHNDGSMVDISYQKCCHKGHGKSSKRRDVCKACRQAISHIIRKFRDGVQYPFSCPITGIMVYSNADCGIDHYDMTFSEVFNAWLEDESCRWSLNDLYADVRRGDKDNTVTHFKSKAIVDSFVAFHNAHTHLRPVSIMESKWSKHKENEIDDNDDDEHLDETVK